MALNIKFSHRYKKFPSVFTPSKLIQVIPLKREAMSKEFIEYDTAIVGGGHYALEKGLYMVLLLKTDNEELWTTIRRYTPRKFEYYSSNIDKKFDIIIKEIHPKKIFTYESNSEGEWQDE